MSFTPNIQAINDWRSFPSDYEWELLQSWLQGLIGTEHDYQARLAINVVAQRLYLADAVQAMERDGGEDRP